MFRFIRGCTYRHMNSGDLDIFIVSVSYFDQTRSKLKIRWKYKKTGKFAHFAGDRYDGIHNIQINSEDYKFWKKI